MFKKTRIKIIAAVMAAIIVLLFGTIAVILSVSYAQMDEDNLRMLEQYSMEYKTADEESASPNIDGNRNDRAGLENAEKTQSGESQNSTVDNSSEQSSSGQSAEVDSAQNSNSDEAVDKNNIVTDDKEKNIPSDKGNIPPEDDKIPSDNQSPEEIHRFDVSTFYSVAMSEDGTVIETVNDSGTLYSDETLEKYAADIVNGSSNQGKIKSLTYLKSEKNGYILVAFIDNSIMQGGMSTVLKSTLIFGGIAVVVVFIISIFLAKKIIAPVEESYKKQKQFISDAGHELKTPVSVVNANAELLLREIGENQWLSNIQYENERMGSLVKQLLDLAKTENVAPQMEMLDFSRITAGELLPFESVAFEHGLEIVSDINENISVEGDAGRLKQLVSILIDNAIRHSENGKKIYVQLKAEHNFVKLSVINEGKEIPADEQKQIFERFYRADAARTDDGHFGLGLAIAKAITESHKGKISVSCHDGKVEFTATIPVKK